jgi:predicted metal-dependent HD superfamily phosphohydrolase
MEIIDTAAAEVVPVLVDYAYQQIDERFGIGGLRPKAYHRLDHTAGVVDVSRRLFTLAIERGHIDPRFSPLGDLAAAFHDIEQELGAGQNEDASKQAVGERMRQTGVFTEDDVETVQKGIDGTKVVFDGGRIIQNGGSDYFSQLIADADLSNIGDVFPVFWNSTLRVFVERNPTSAAQSAGQTGNVWRSFLADQEVLTSTHEFYTSEARDLFPHQGSNCLAIRALKNRRVPESIARLRLVLANS